MYPGEGDFPGNAVASSAGAKIGRRSPLSRMDLMAGDEHDRDRAELIGDIYDAAFDPAAFAGLGARLASAVAATNGVVVVREGGLPVELSTTTSAEAGEAYLAYYGRLDPWTPATLRAPLGAFVHSADFISDAEVERTEFYQDYARQLGIFRPAGTRLRLGERRTLTIGVSRPIEAPRFLGADEARFMELARHVQRAMQLRERALRPATNVQAGSAVLDALAFGAIVVDAEARIVYLNATAEALQGPRRGLLLDSGQVTAIDPREARRLAALIHAAAMLGASGGIRVSDDSGDTGLMALVTPLPARVGTTRPGGALALVSVRPPEERPLVPEAVLSELFGLSASEAKLARALATGRRLEEIAADRDVKVSTLKTQLLSVFRKTGAETQRDLVLLLGSLPQVRWGALGRGRGQG